MSKSRPLSELDKLFSEEELKLCESKTSHMLFSIQLMKLMEHSGKTKEQLLAESTLTQDDFEQIEHSGLDITVSVLSRYIQALGGKLTLSAMNSNGDKVLSCKL
ncbi:hypothetical protein [Vibrio sp. VB16]|uniref:hypothetical protein n=1 Tax=Vibrio sp. VB16 TaxID=2785746 RepID=UPI00189D6AF6|nr:hypothetical protein [Vibrio sp. VB16]UGA55420.1 5'-nucleotidase [Vibrio sp. VB16]